MKEKQLNCILDEHNNFHIKISCLLNHFFLPHLFDPIKKNSDSKFIKNKSFFKKRYLMQDF